MEVVEVDRLVEVVEVLVVVRLVLVVEEEVVEIEVEVVVVESTWCWCWSPTAGAGPAGRLLCDTVSVEAFSSPVALANAAAKSRCG